MVYALFLRGINVGGNKIIKMADLKRVLEGAGFTKVKTLLASGNVVLESAKRSTDIVKKEVEELLAQNFGGKTSVIIRTSDDIRKSIELDPFTSIVVTKDVRHYVTYLTATPDSHEIPKEMREGNFRILKITDGEVYSVLKLSPEGKTTELMGMIEKRFGKVVTTRSWNTVQKVAKLMT